MFWEMKFSQNVKPFPHKTFSFMNYCIVSMSMLVYKQKQPFADVLQNGCPCIYCKIHKKAPVAGFPFLENCSPPVCCMQIY